MALTRIGGTVVLVAVTGAILGILTSLVTVNDLLASSEWQVPALASLGLVLLVLVVFGAIGAPWQRWKRTSYW